jgi:lipopolysaccharide/colanic/teichoic acid biosynthesis glycosyltransferase
MYPIVKRIADFCVALLCLIVFSPIIIVAVLIACIDTKSWGIFKQVRIGLHQKEFTIYKVKTMRDVSNETTQVTSVQTMRITKSGHFFRKFKIDELTQFWNVLVGDMSFVGPRPDTYEMYNSLTEEERSIILSVRPGITSLASVTFYDEEALLNQKEDPLAFYHNFVKPEKIKLNIAYVQNQSFVNDFALLWRTFTGLFVKPKM